MTAVFIVLNAGSSSLKFQIFEVRDGHEPLSVFKGLFERVSAAKHTLSSRTWAASSWTS